MTPRERESRCKTTGETQNTDGGKQTGTYRPIGRRRDKRGGRRGAESSDIAGGVERTTLPGSEGGKTKMGTLGYFPP